jgi:hypothetical protein
MFCSKWTFHHISQPWALPLMQYHSEKSILSKQTNNSISIYINMTDCFCLFPGNGYNWKFESSTVYWLSKAISQYNLWKISYWCFIECKFFLLFVEDILIGVLFNVSSSYYLWKISSRCFIECKFLLFVEDIL